MLGGDVGALDAVKRTRSRCHGIKVVDDDLWRGIFILESSLGSSGSFVMTMLLGSHKGDGRVQQDQQRQGTDWNLHGWWTVLWKNESIGRRIKRR